MNEYRLSRRGFLRLCGVTAAGLACPAAAEKRSRPNFLFLFTDDQTFRSINALNNPEVKTPNFDRLVENGTTFTHAFNQGSWSGAVCICSRAMLNSGLHLYHAQRNLEKTPLWGQTFGAAGYNTWVTGKWHNGPRTLAKSFKAGESVGGGMYDAKDQYDRPKPGGVDWKPWDRANGGHWRPTVADFEPGSGDPAKCLVNRHTVEQHTTDLYADNAVRFLKENAAKSDDPFFMYVSFNAPHDPRQSPKEYVDMYPPEKISLPPNYLPEHPFDQGERYTLRDEKLGPFPRTPEAVKTHISEYYAIITHADAAVGRILDALEATGKAGNTYVIFSADHGLAVGQHGLMGKQNQYEHSIRLPLIVRGPGIRKGRTIDAMVYLHSLFPTTCDLAGIPIPPTVQAQSLAPLLAGGKERVCDAIYGSYKEFQRMVRTEDYKLIVYPAAGEVQLFDMKNDPWEMQDLADEARYAGVIARLLDKLKNLQKEVGDTLELKLPAGTSKG
ncbi:MAG: sulfatase-like hydrolase/transferase [Phycisphaerae bacterium]|nr:sulfatase-like hydrolase/transferase [Phycisphaerae bacterium]